MPSLNIAVRFSTSAMARVACDALVVPMIKPFAFKEAPLKTLDRAVGNMITLTAKEEKFDGDLKKTLVLRKGPSFKIKARRVVMLGLGDAKGLSPEKVAQATARAISSVKGLKGLRTVAIFLQPIEAHMPAWQVIQAVSDGIHQAGYHSLEAKGRKSSLRTAILIKRSMPGKTLRDALKTGQVLAAARSFAKDLVNMPSNLKRTRTLANAARKIAKDSSAIHLKIHSNISWIAKNMPAFHAVSLGSLKIDPPQFITMSYRPSGRIKKRIAIVGKSVIFDTGGYQVKPGMSMVGMKGDMTGGAMVLGAMQALAKLKPKGLAVDAYLAATPNRISDQAMVPDAIVGTTCGKKVEIRHTDAEGRLTLIDAVAMAAKKKPDEILTVATLTGAAMRAVGRTIALMSNNDDLRQHVLEAAQTQGDPMQPLDVVDEDYETIKSKLDGADLRNTGRSRNRGAQSAAAFVMCGAPEGMPLVHLDIAGADMTDDEKATGIGQKTIIQYLLNAAEKLSGLST